MLTVILKMEDIKIYVSITKSTEDKIMLYNLKKKYHYQIDRFFNLIFASMSTHFQVKPFSVELSGGCAEVE